MAEIIKLIGQEMALSTANTVGLASAVRCYNNTAGQVLLTIANGGTTVATVTLGAGATEYYQKQPAWTITANAAIRAVSVAFN
jgi:hypothetical protein